MSDCPVCVGIPGYEYHTCGQVNECDKDMHDCPVCEKGKLTQYSVCNGCGSEIADAEQMRFNILKYTEGELQEELRLQRIACYENLLLKLSSIEFNAIPLRIHERIKELVLNAR